VLAARERYIDILHRPLLELLRRSFAGKPAQAGTAVLVACQDAHEFRLPAPASQHVLNGQVQVGPVVQVKVLLDHGEIGRLRIEVLAQTTEQQGCRLALFACLAWHETYSCAEWSTITPCSAGSTAARPPRPLVHSARRSALFLARTAPLPFTRRVQRRGT
jgi:hypothetical protein